MIYKDFFMSRPKKNTVLLSFIGKLDNGKYL